LFIRVICMISCASPAISRRCACCRCKGMARDVARGISLLERACEGTDAGSCIPLGMRYAQGVGVNVDKARAARYLTKACEAGLTMACEQALELSKTK
jgi:TPR repeat protein